MLSELLPKIITDTMGLLFTTNVHYGIPCIVIKETRKNAAKDSSTERFLYQLKQSTVILLTLYKESQPCMMDGPEHLIKQIQEKQNADNNASRMRTNKHSFHN